MASLCSTGRGPMWAASGEQVRMVSSRPDEGKQEPAGNGSDTGGSGSHLTSGRVVMRERMPPCYGGMSADAGTESARNRPKASPSPGWLWPQLPLSRRRWLSHAKTSTQSAIHARQSNPATHTRNRKKGPLHSNPWIGEDGSTRSGSSGPFAPLRQERRSQIATAAYAPRTISTNARASSLVARPPRCTSPISR